MAWITSTQARLQAAADATALAGARQLMSGFVAFHAPQATGTAAIITSAESSAKTYAQSFAGYNAAGGVGSLTLSSSNVEFGYTNSSGSYSKAASGAYPNTCKVTLRLDGSANRALPLFFAPVLGMSNKTLTATAAATIYTGSTVSSFNTAANINGGLLPVALDANAWANFYATGVSPDGTVHLGSNGLPQAADLPLARQRPRELRPPERRPARDQHAGLQQLDRQRPHFQRSRISQ